MSWNIFANLFQRGPDKLAVNAHSSLLDLPENRMLTLPECEDIYVYWGLGKRIIHSIIRFALSAEREITIAKAPAEAVDRFKKTAEVLQQDWKVRRTAAYCRIYGMSGIFAATDNEAVKTIDNLTKSQCQDPDHRIIFNALNPLNLSGTYFNQIATSTRYQKPEAIYVAGEKTGTKRATVIQANEPIYLKFTDATFTFSGISVYQNMVPLIKGWVHAVISLKRMATKASSIVFKEARGGKASGIMAEAAHRGLELIQQLENYGAAALNKDSDATFFPLTGVQEVDAILSGLNNQIMLALDDTPAPILLGKDISSGLAEGTEEMKAIIMAVDNFRRDVLSPLYKFTDPYVMAVAWTDEFVESVKASDMQTWGNFTTDQIRQIWEESFSYVPGNLYPTPEKTVQDTNGVILDNLTKARNLGMDTTDIEAEINERKIFKNSVTLDENNIIPEQPEEEEEDEPEGVPETKDRDNEPKE